MTPVRHARRLGVALLALVLLVGVAACGDDAEEPDEINLTMGLALLQGCPFCLSVARGAEDAAEELGVNLEVTEPPTIDTAGQIQQLNALLANPPDMLLLQPWDAVALGPSVQAFKDAGISSIMVDTDVEDQSLRLGVITSNNYDGGVLAAEQLAEMVGETGQVVVITLNPGASTTDQRLAGFEATIANYPDIDYIGAQYTADDQAEAASVMNAVLVGNPDIVGVFATAESQSIGVATALGQADLGDQVSVIAFDGSPAEVQALRDGDFDLLIVQKAYEMGYMAVQQAVAFLRDDTEVPAVTNPDYVLVTIDNVDDEDVAKYLYPES